MEELRELTAAILAGGLGTRLRPAVADRPKVLAQVRGRPFLSYLLDQLVDVGIRSVVLCTGYRGEQVQSEFGPSYRSLKLAYSQESSPLGTAGALRLALPFFPAAFVLVMNGDSFCQVALDAFWLWHSERIADASLGLAHVSDTGRYGSVRVDAAGRVLGFDEKHGGNEPGWINAGVYLLNRDLLQTVPMGREVSLERETFPAWLQRRLYGYQNTGRFLDIGTPESYREAESFFSVPVY